jgi:hypothetical protein
MVKQEDPVTSSERLKLAMEIEFMSIEMANNLKDPWRYEVLRPQDVPEGAFRHNAHHYESYPAARMWNTIRMVRILVNELICEEMEMIDNDEVNSRCLIQTLAAETVRSLAVDILASTPQFIRGPQSKKLTATTASGFMYPLSTVAASKLACMEGRQYAIETITHIGREARLPQACQVVQILKEGGVPLRL